MSLMSQDLTPLTPNFNFVSGEPCHVDITKSSSQIFFSSTHQSNLLLTHGPASVKKLGNVPPGTLGYFAGSFGLTIPATILPMVLL